MTARQGTRKDGSARKPLVRRGENGGADAAQQHPLRSKDPGLAVAVKNGADSICAWGSGVKGDSGVQVHETRDIVGVRVDDVFQEGLGALLQQIQGIDRAGLTAPVLVHEHLAAAHVVRLLFAVLETTAFAHDGMELANGAVFDWKPI